MNVNHIDLIDTTEMYLRTVYELEEEGVVPLRARIAERLGQSGPTVSQTVARMERDGLLHVADDRHLELSAEGRRHATAVMRKHRLAERLLHDVLGLDWDRLHIEACRWEHVMSDEVEERILLMLKGPMVCPHGNPIPGLELLGRADSAAGPLSTQTLLSAAGTSAGALVTVERISEQIQPDDALMRSLYRAGVLPGRQVTVRRSVEGVWVDGPAAADEVSVPSAEYRLDHFTAEHVFVVPALEPALV